MRLCSNRPEGLGPHSNLHPSLPTTCFIDVIVTPLATWLYLAALLFVLPVLFLRRNRFSTTPYASDPDHEKARPARRNVWRIVLRVLYYFFAVALIAMISLEIARLVDAELGIGLLPFMYPGIILAAALHALVCRQGSSKAGSRTLAKSINALYWVLLAVVFAIKVATYVKEGVHSRDGIEPIDRYKVVDEVTDVGVMIFLAVVLVVLEFVAQ
ncbi:hypothetical protein Slin15195_G070510 [Septoria linicola]|uniref:Uncharacterized protein n=1 Tax=Septoria linicola TaxID=215465 RepID=A0A9Q9EKW6_9PEZI|nr:hypothetical protein Slin14017_G103260 [Septoria linicola]USW53732.1 hypothetical protein Slin15195_G070510 [Septoria linicola]